MVDERGPAQSCSQNGEDEAATTQLSVVLNALVSDPAVLLSEAPTSGGRVLQGQQVLVAAGELLCALDVLLDLRGEPAPGAPPPHPSPAASRPLADDCWHALWQTLPAHVCTLLETSSLPPAVAAPPCPPPPPPGGGGPADVHPGQLPPGGGAHVGGGRGGGGGGGGGGGEEAPAPLSEPHEEAPFACALRLYVHVVAALVRAEETGLLSSASTLLGLQSACAALGITASKITHALSEPDRWRSWEARQGSHVNPHTTGRATCGPGAREVAQVAGVMVQLIKAWVRKLRDRACLDSQDHLRVMLPRVTMLLEALAMPLSDLAVLCGTELAREPGPAVTSALTSGGGMRAAIDLSRSRPCCRHPPNTDADGNDENGDRDSKGAGAPHGARTRPCACACACACGGSRGPAGAAQAASFFGLLRDGASAAGRQAGSAAADGPGPELSPAGTGGGGPPLKLPSVRGPSSHGTAGGACGTLPPHQAQAQAQGINPTLTSPHAHADTHLHPPPLPQALAKRQVAPARAPAPLASPQGPLPPGQGVVRSSARLVGKKPRKFSRRSHQIIELDSPSASEHELPPPPPPSAPTSHKFAQAGAGAHTALVLPPPPLHPLPKPPAPAPSPAPAPTSTPGAAAAAAERAAAAAFVPPRKRGRPRLHPVQAARIHAPSAPTAAAAAASDVGNNSCDSEYTARPRSGAREAWELKRHRARKRREKQLAAGRGVLPLVARQPAAGAAATAAGRERHNTTTSSSRVFLATGRTTATLLEPAGAAYAYYASTFNSATAGSRRVRPHAPTPALAAYAAAASYAPGTATAAAARKEEEEEEEDEEGAGPEMMTPVCEYSEEEVSDLEPSDIEMESSGDEATEIARFEMRAAGSTPAKAARAARTHLLQDTAAAAAVLDVAQARPPGVVLVNDKAREVNELRQSQFPTMLAVPL
eukprot:jgi/Mesen1/1392/ME000013S00879